MLFICVHMKCPADVSASQRCAQKRRRKRDERLKGGDEAEDTENCVRLELRWDGACHILLSQKFVILHANCAYPAAIHSFFMDVCLCTHAEICADRARANVRVFHVLWCCLIYKNACFSSIQLSPSTTPSPNSMLSSSNTPSKDVIIVIRTHVICRSQDDKILSYFFRCGLLGVTGGTVNIVFVAAITTGIYCQEHLSHLKFTRNRRKSEDDDDEAELR